MTLSFIDFVNEIKTFLKIRSEKENGSRIRCRDKFKEPALRINRMCDSFEKLLIIGTLLNASQSSIDGNKLELHRHILNGDNCRHGVFIYNDIMKNDDIKLDLKICGKTKQEGKASVQRTLNMLQELGINDYTHNFNNLDLNAVSLCFRLYLFENNKWTFKDSVTTDIVDQKRMNNNTVRIEAVEYIDNQGVFILVINGNKKFLDKNSYHLEVRGVNDTNYTFLCDFLNSHLQNCKYFQAEFNRQEHAFIRIQSSHFISEEFELEEKHFYTNISEGPFEVENSFTQYASGDYSHVTAGLKRARVNLPEINDGGLSLGTVTVMKEPEPKRMTVNISKDRFFCGDIKECSTEGNKQLESLDFQGIFISNEDNQILDDINPSIPASVGVSSEEQDQNICSNMGCQDRALLSCGKCFAGFCIEHYGECCTFDSDLVE